MAVHDWGNQVVHSTGANTASNPSTATLVAEIDSTQLRGVTGTPGRRVPCRLTAIIGGSTTCDWRIEQARSTGLGSSAIRQVVPILTPTGQSGQYVVGLTIEPGDRVRARLNSSFTGTANAFLQIEPLT